MAWDIVAIGTNHNLPIEDPIKTAERISSLVDKPISVGYYVDWEYTPHSNSIVKPDEHHWTEIARIEPIRDGKNIIFSIPEYCARQIYDKIGKRLDQVNFKDKMHRDWFYNDATDEPFALFECDSEEPPFFDLRVFKEIVNFSVEFPGRWFQFVRVLKTPFSQPYYKYLQQFRYNIFQQLKVCGCDKAYYFADEGPGELLYDIIDKSGKEWVEYFEKGEWVEDGDPTIVEVKNLLNGSLVLSEEDWIDCIVDDFSDFKIL